MGSAPSFLLLITTPWLLSSSFPFFFSMFAGLDYASATLGVSMGNLIPAITFLLAIFLRMEKLDLRKLSSVSKVLGTAIAISGAFLIIFYKGQAIYTVASSLDSAQQLLSEHSNWVVGGGFITITCFSSAIWNILQAATIKVYCDATTINFFFCFFGSIQCIAVSLYMERDSGSWVLNPGIETIAVVFAAVNCVTRASIITWCLQRKGTVYVSIFKPVSTAIAMVTGIIFLGDTLYSGSVIGAVTIVAGFYALIWGQNQEKKTVLVDFACEAESSTQTAPLLQ
ncbi:hypothetical protein ACET3Z_022116 [Daucus carota]